MLIQNAISEFSDAQRIMTFKLRCGQLSRSFYLSPSVDQFSGMSQLLLVNKTKILQDLFVYFPGFRRLQWLPGSLSCPATLFGFRPVVVGRDPPPYIYSHKFAQLNSRSNAPASLIQKNDYGNNFNSKGVKNICLRKKEGEK